MPDTMGAPVAQTCVESPKTFGVCPFQAERARTAAGNSGKWGHGRCKAEFSVGFDGLAVGESTDPARLPTMSCRQHLLGNIPAGGYRGQVQTVERNPHGISRPDYRGGAHA